MNDLSLDSDKNDSNEDIICAYTDGMTEDGIYHSMGDDNDAFQNLDSPDGSECGSEHLGNLMEQRYFDQDVDPFESLGEEVWF